MNRVTVRRHVKGCGKGNRPTRRFSQKQDEPNWKLGLEGPFICGCTSLWQMQILRNFNCSVLLWTFRQSTILFRVFAWNTHSMVDLWFQTKIQEVFLGYMLKYLLQETISAKRGCKQVGHNLKHTRILLLYIYSNGKMKKGWNPSSPAFNLLVCLLKNYRKFQSLSS